MPGLRWTAWWGAGFGLMVLALACNTPSIPARTAPPVIESLDPGVSPGPTRASGQPSASSTSGQNLAGVLQCEGTDIEVPANVLREPANAELRPDAPAVALRQFLATPEATSLEMPSTGWRRVSASAESVTFLGQNPPGWAVATFTQAPDGTWQFYEGGSCALRIRLPEELGFATWRLDPDHPPAPDDLIVNVLISEVACSSGQSPIGRVLSPVVLSADDALTIAIAVRKRPGDQDCQGSPEVPFVVQLAEPVGNRALFDGSSFPAVRRN